GPLSRPARSVTASSSTPPSPATTRSSTPSLHDALPICAKRSNTLFFQHLNGGQTFGSHRDFHHNARNGVAQALRFFHHTLRVTRSEEHTSELQSRFELVCRPLLDEENITCGRPATHVAR